MRPYLLVCVVLLLLTLGSGLFPAASHAAPLGASLAPFTVAVQQDGVTVSWDETSATARSTLSALPTVEVNGVDLPAVLLTVAISHNRPLVPHVAVRATTPWQDTVQPVPAIVPEDSDGNPRPALQSASAATLPVSPVTVLREGRVQGERFAVLAISPLYVQQGNPVYATAMTITLTEVTLLEQIPIPSGRAATARRADPQSESLSAVSSPPPTVQSTTVETYLPLVHVYRPPVAPPTNPFVAQNAWKIRVEQSGIQRVQGTDLATAGADLAALNVANLQVWAAQGQVALDLRGMEDGRFDPDDEVRFYAATPGDRWNTTTIYWLGVGREPGIRMEQVPSTVPTGTPRTTAMTSGIWRDNAVYDSLLPGPDGDYWYAFDMRTGGGLPPATATIDLGTVNNLTTGTTTLTLQGAAYTPGPHTLVVTMGNASTEVTWSGTGNWEQTVTFEGTPRTTLDLELVPGSNVSAVELDAVRWAFPITLDTEQRGLRFTTPEANAVYELDTVAPDASLYIIADDSRPRRVDTAAGWVFTPLAEWQDYVLAGTGTLHTPTVQAYTPASLLDRRGVDTLYIAPASLHAPLAPLVEHRRTQGHTVLVIDVQQVYDVWSFGQVDPVAIRSFLRYAHSTWGVRPQAVTLVGDGTADPLNHTGRDNPNLIPPYLAYVDPWIGETACDTCYAQLNGDDPLSDGLPDLWLGRLPVKDAAELAMMVQKLITYDTTDLTAAWRNRALFLSDNSYEADGRPDPAGDFLADADAAIAMQPTGVEIARLAYDPSPGNITADWREPDHRRANERTRNLLNAGAALVTYQGHSHHWQWALTDLSQEPSHLLELFEVDTLRNGTRLPVVLTMTCLSSAFQTPAFSGTTIDERIVLHDAGGGIAVWGPTGRSVAYGHNLLLEGFFNRLWATPNRGNAPLGALVQAGYEELFFRGDCCQSTLYTYALLGDPRTQLVVPLPPTQADNVQE